jgi:hypothetical protein
MLSTDFVFSPIEKIRLARAHKVAAWLDKGIIGLLNGNLGPTLEDLATLGWETAARILWIRDKIHANKTLHFRRDEIKCGSCSSDSDLININTEWICDFCGEDVPPDGELTVPEPGTVSGLAERLVQLGEIQCSNIECQQAIFYPISVNCPDCWSHHSSDDNVRITSDEVKALIEEMFGDEIRNYEVA